MHEKSSAFFEQERKSMYCKHCGKEIKEGFAFCQYCGTPTRGTKEEPPKKKKTGKWVLVVSGGILLAAVAVSAVSVAMKTKVDSENQTVAEEQPAEERLQEETDRQKEKAEEDKKQQEIRRQAERTAAVSYRELALKQNEYGEYPTCALQDIDGDGLPEFFVNPSEDVDMGCDYVMYTCKNGKMEKSGHVSGGPELRYITETREFICSCADGLTVYIWENNGLKEKVSCSYKEEIFKEYKDKGTEMEMFYPGYDRMERMQEFDAKIRELGLDSQTAETTWDKDKFCQQGEFKSMIQQKLAYSGELVVCESQISDILFRYPKEWKDRFYFQESENGLSIFSQDMMNCAEKMNGEPGYWRHCSFLVAKVFYNFHDVDSCWQALQNSQDPVYSEDMFFGLGAEKENLHLLKDEDGNSFVVYVDDRADRPDKWAEFEGYDTECEEYGQNMREILLNWEIVLAGFSKKI